jgi:hypothetical protein
MKHMSHLQTSHHVVPTNMINWNYWTYLMRIQNKSECMDPVKKIVYKSYNTRQRSLSILILSYVADFRKPDIISIQSIHFAWSYLQINWLLIKFIAKFTLWDKNSTVFRVRHNWAHILSNLILNRISFMFTQDNARVGSKTCWHSFLLLHKIQDFLYYCWR